MALEDGNYLTDGTDLYCFRGFMDGKTVALENARTNATTVLKTSEFIAMKLKAVTPLRKGTKSRARGKRVKAKAA